MLFFFFLVSLGCLVMLVMIYVGLQDLIREIKGLHTAVTIVTQTLENRLPSTRP